jgi:hypothetical protein
MRVYRVGYPIPDLRVGDATISRSVGDTNPVHFPERHLSYILVGCNTGEAQLYASEVRKAVDLHEPGTEPRFLEIRLITPMKSMN